MSKINDINLDLERLLQEKQLVFENTVGSIDTRVLSAYNKTYDEVGKTIKKVYNDFGPKPTITQVRKYSRWVQIKKDLASKIGALDKHAKNIIHGGVKSVAVEGFKEVGESISIASGLSIEFTPAIQNTAVQKIMGDNSWLDSLTNAHGKLYTDVKREMETVLRANSKEEIVAGLAVGKPYTEVMKTLTDRFNIPAKRAKMISFTEMHKGHSAARSEAMDESVRNAKELGVTAEKVWRENHAAKEDRPSHVAADGKAADEKGMFQVGGETLAGPGLGSDPANNIYCHCSLDFRIADNLETEQILVKKAKPTATDKVTRRADQLFKALFGDSKFKQTTKEAREIIQKGLARDAASSGARTDFFYSDATIKFTETVYETIGKGLDEIHPGLGKRYYKNMTDWFEGSSAREGAAELKYWASKANNTAVYYQEIPGVTETRFIDTVKDLQDKYVRWMQKSLKDIPEDKVVDAVRFIRRTNQLVGKELFGTSEVTVYRGVKKPYFEKLGLNIRSFKAGVEVNVAESSLTSWSLSKNIVKGFGDVVFQTTVKWDEVFGGVLTNSSTYTEEAEIILMLKRNVTKAKVVLNKYL